MMIVMVMAVAGISQRRARIVEVNAGLIQGLPSKIMNSPRTQCNYVSDSEPSKMTAKARSLFNTLLKRSIEQYP